MLEINLLPLKDFVKIQKAKIKFVVYILCLILIGGGLFGYSSYLSSEISTLKTQKEDLNTELIALKKKIGEVNKYKKLKASMASKVKAIKSLSEQRRNPVRHMDELVASLDPKVWIETYKTSEASVELNGYALTEEAVAGFMKNLNASPYYDSIELKAVERSKKGANHIYKFGIKAKLTAPKKGGKNG